MIKIKEVGWGSELPEGYDIVKEVDLPVYKGVHFIWLYVEIKINIFAWWYKTLTFKSALKIV